MKNKTFVTVLTIIVTLLCLYYLHFTFVSRSVQKNATEYATSPAGEFNPNKKQSYLDSVWNKPVYSFLGMKDFTYKDIKNNEISLGLDLQGGMHVTLEVYPVDIIKGLANNSQDSAFLKAISKASARAKNSQQSYTSLFFEAYREDNPNKKLAPLFATATTRGRIGINATDNEVVNIVEEEVENAIDRSYIIIRNRMDQFGASQANTQRQQGTGRIQVEIPGAENPARVRKLLSGVAKLEFWDVIEPNTLNTSLIAINDLLVKEQQAKSALATSTDKTPATDNTQSTQADTTKTLSDLEKTLANAADSSLQGLDSLQNLNISPLFALSYPTGSFRYYLRDTATINRIFRRDDVKSVLPRNVGIFWANKAERLSKDALSEEPALELFFLDMGRNRKAKLTGEVITSANKDIDEKGLNAVSMRMDATGTRVWAKWTADAATKRSRIAIMLDNVVYSAPYVNGEIPNGNSQISGSFTSEEASDLANILKAGSLPAPMTIVEQTVVGPSLGAESIQNGLISIIVGFLIIILFMVVTYSSAGWVADAAVLLNLFFLLGVLASINAALTLPGIAGILLSLAIAVDANVLINERVKEDLNIGKPMNIAIENGYRNAFWAIFDSNVTTLIKGVVLVVFGTGLIYGFAVTLIIGIICSFFTSVLFTRLLFEAYTKKGRRVSFSLPWSKDLFRSISIDFIGKRKLFYTISGVVILAGLVSLGIKGLNYGVDFKGGRTYIVQFEKPVDIEELRKSLTESFGAQPEVKTYGFDGKFQVTTSYRIDDDSEAATSDAENKLQAGMSKFSGNKGTILGGTTVGPTVATDIRIAAVKALTIAMALMFLYILIRFRKWQFALGTMVSLVHTVLVVVSLYSILESVMPFSMEVDQAFIAAILTVIGYSINDSVVVFDRVREFLTGMKTGEDQPKVINSALNDTLSRTLITGMSTIFVIIILFLFGGETIKGFTFAMLIGVLVGTYSSLCIGTPVLVDFSTKKEKKLQPARV
jgi:SecD/SecF fusion protein